MWKTKEMRLMPKASKKSFGRGGFGQGQVHEDFYKKELQQNRIDKKLDVIEKKFEDFKKIINDLLKQIKEAKR
jgi:hypothetical protein